MKRWRRSWPAVACACACAAVGAAQAHGFDERYDLPVPLSWVIVGACTAVLLSFVLAALFTRAAPRETSGAVPVALSRWGRTLRIPRGLLRALRGSCFLLAALTIAAALWGTRDPLMNLAPAMVSIAWWIGLSFASALVCNLWPALDPWRSAFETLDAGARRLGRPAGLGLGLRWPAALGQWPAVVLLLAWSWLEVVQPLASMPRQLGLAALAWTALSLLGMAVFGRAAWQAHADPFAIAFATLGRMAPLRLAFDDPEPASAPAGRTAFVIALLATVIFDGLHGGAAWNAFEDGLHTVAAHWMDLNGRFAGTAGLLLVWLAILLAYRATLLLSLRLAGRMPASQSRTLKAHLAVTLVPIAAAYSVAHNFSILVIQGQTVVQLLSDPFGWQWDLFGTARWHPDIGLIDARLTWAVAVAAIVVGHVASIAWSHRVVRSSGLPAMRAGVAMLPLTILMMGYTAISLMLIAEPMVLPTLQSTFHPTSNP